ncbi:hypothetical protein [Moorena sp. SIO3H5]|uniref:hypothetical protein n=1 Tax=Moorena sp. SIO3H5 TaxID=2607834 RepID=UPI0013B98F67|nr:hypothetical protein [Moorena sp. SIO3H5]NEO70243.1 hypothetical protein [Moorena sp. SIO3H5]
MNSFVERASYWNGYQAWNGHQTWNGHLARYNISASQDTHSTDIHSAPEQLTIGINRCLYASISSLPILTTLTTFKTLTTLSTLFPSEDQSS